MTKVSESAAAAMADRPTPTCPAWCTHDHAKDRPSMFIHTSAWLRSEIRWTFAVSLTRVECPDPRDKFQEQGTRVYIDGDGDMLVLSPTDAVKMAGVLDTLGQVEAAGLVRQAVAIAAADIAKDVAK